MKSSKFIKTNIHEYLNENNIEQLKNNMISVFSNKIEGRFLNKKQAEELQKELFKAFNSKHNESIKLNDNFWKWFGDSKVVDSNGKPLIVYHGSSNEFDTFYEDSFFTDDYYNADGYASGEYVYEVYLSIKKPFILDCDGRKWDDLNTHYGTSTTSILGRVDRTKYDAVIFTNIKDSWIDDVDYQEPSTVYVAFTPKQVKSVDNDGTFDIDDNNIYS